MEHTIKVDVFSREAEERILEMFQWCVDQFGLPTRSQKIPVWFRKFHLTYEGKWNCNTILVLDGYRFAFTFDRNAAILFKLKWGEYCNGH